MNRESLTPEALRAAFDAPEPLTLGIEEELMLLHPASGELVSRAAELLDRVEGDPRFKLELPASQIEIVLPPVADAGEAAAPLIGARRDLAAAAAGLADLAAAGLHPLAPAEGELNPGERYERTADDFGRIARRQLVHALHVHVAPGSADAALSLYNDLRSYLPELAALAANAPFHEGLDTGMASWRPKLAEGLPRQGVPPALESWEELAEAFAWGARSGRFPDASAWWWELRLNPRVGTLELRVPDAQTTVAEALAVAAFAHALVAWLAERHASGEVSPPAAGWRIAENRWLAARGGVEGELVDLATGEPRPTRERLLELLEACTPAARRLGAGELAGARALIEANGAMRQRDAAATSGIDALPGWLRDRFLDHPS
jgi:carboxylate-amine ligase